MDLTQFSPSSALLTVVVLALAPFVAVMVTSFTKLVVVLSLLRNALGLQQVPPNTVLNGLALVLSIYVMYPVGTEMAAKMQGINDIGSSTQAMLKAADTAKEPLREFLAKHARPVERAFFFKTAQKALKPEQAAKVTDRDFLVIVPAFTVSELSVAFEIGFLIFLPFLVIDLVISNILMAMGMMMLSPTTVSMPFKLLLFVLIDGWVKLTHGLILTYLKAEGSVMLHGDIIQLTQQALWFVLLLSAPPIIVAAVVGLLIAFVQAATQLQEQTLQYVAKFFAIVITIFITASMLGGGLYQFGDRVFSGFAGMVRQ